MKQSNQKLFLTLLAATCITTSALVADDGVTIQFETSPQGHIIIPVTVNDVIKQRYVFDTGAAVTALNKSRMAENIYNSAKARKANLSRAHKTIETEIIPLRSLDVAGLKQSDVDAILMDLSDIEAGAFRIDGIVGYNFFGAYDISINYAAKELTFSKPKDAAVCDAMSGIEFTLNAGTHIEFPITFGAKTMPAILDTGSSRTGMNSNAAEYTMPGVLKQLEAAMVAHASSGNNSYSHAGDSFKGQLGIGKVSIGGAEIANSFPVNVVDLAVFSAFGMGDTPGVIVGADLLKNKRVNISYACNKLHIQ